LDRDNRGWAKVSLAYESVGDLKKGSAWIADWRQREPSAPWMLHPATLILRALGRYDEAEAATRKALSIEQEDNSVPDFRVWLAFEEVLRNNTEEALAQLRLVGKEHLSDITRIVLSMAETLVLIQQTGPRHRRAAFEEAKRRERYRR
jgi:tetratricopeptide (TPR) repeat protein